MANIDFKKMPYFRFAREFFTDSHYYEHNATFSNIQIMYIVEGQLIIEYNGKREITEKGDIICYPSTFPITEIAEGYHCHRIIGFQAEIIEKTAPDGLYLPFIIKASHQTEGIIKAIDSYIYKVEMYAKVSDLKAVSDFLSILSKIDSLFRGTNEDEFINHNEYVVKAQKYIFNHICEPITQTEIASVIDIAPSYLCVLFKEYVGKNLIRYVNEIKLKRIKECIDRENMKLYEAALKFGFADANYVSRLYKKYFGVNITYKAKSPEVTSLD